MNWQFSCGWNVVVFALLQITWTTAQLTNTESSFDLETICSAVVDTARAWGRKLIQFEPRCQEKLRGLGPKVLEVAKLTSDYSDLPADSCYTPITNALCSVQFAKWESLPGCPDTVQTFFDIVATCRTSRDPYAAFCPTFTLSANQIIQDPVGFCAQASIRVDGPTDPATGLPASFKTKTFTDGEQQDCQHIAMIYNACRSIGVAQLNYTDDYCVTAAFPAYCDRSLTVVNDAQYRLACENVVVPALAEHHFRHRRRADSEFCHNFYQKWLTYLAARKGAAYLKSRAAYLSLQSTSRPLLHINKLKASILKSQTMDTSYVHVWDNVKELMRQVDPTGTSKYPTFILPQFDASAKAVNEAATFSMRLTLPWSGASHNQRLSEARRVNLALDELVALETRAMTFIRGLEKMLQQYLTNTLPANLIVNPEFQEINPQSILDIGNQVAATVQQTTSFRGQYNSLLNAWPIEVMSNDQQFVYEGIRQVRLGLLRDTQLRLLMSINFKMDANDYIKNLQLPK